MLRFKSITIENFGPYRGKQTFSLPNENGVVIVWGRNGIGKTSLLNCFRFALWGNVFNRRQEKADVTSYINVDAIEAGESMSVALSMEYDGKPYILKRQYKRKDLRSSGKMPDDYEILISLNQSGSILSPKDREHLLQQILPEKVSRFYLFDGELLREYEDLLDTLNESNNIIKQSIEKILGLPVLENGRDYTSVIKDDYTRQANKIAAKEVNVQKYKIALEAHEERARALKEEDGNLRADLTRYQREKGDAEALLSSSKPFRELLDKEKSVQNIILGLESNLENKSNILKALMNSAWRDLLNPTIQSIIDKSLDEAQNLQKENDRQVKIKCLIDIFNKALNADDCPLCNQSIDERTKQSIDKHAKKLIAMLDKTSINDKRQEHILSNIKVFSKIKTDTQKPDIQRTFREIKEINSQLSLKEVELQNIRKTKSQSVFAGQDFEMRHLLEKYRKTVLLIDQSLKGIREAEEKITEEEDSVKKMQLKIEKSSQNSDAILAFQKAKICDHIADIFEKGIDRFQNKLRQRIETDATAFFVKMANDSSYTKLRINENYGLEIETANGRTVPNRSSGYEQVVAISLIGALHKNAPISGPVIMDSTFQRIDEIHKSSLLNLLPELGEQILVLAYPGEIDVQEARNTLAGLLREEHELVYQGEFSTTIQ